jgi:UDP-4-amino-4,6-dideoxy-N-acetyl-beta-L-altrosamine transaminase
MSERFLAYGRQLVDDEDIAAVSAILRGEMLTTGPAVDRFERQVAERAGARHAIAVNSATSGLHVACLAARLVAGTETVTSPITFVASANCVKLTGGAVHLADIDSQTLSMSPAALARRLETNPAVKAVIPVHLGGLACDSAEIRAVAGSRLVIEDAAHSFGGDYADGRPVGCGAHADMSVFSFHPVKPITTGEGGAVVTNDDELARLLRLFRSHGIEREASRLVALDEEGEDAPGSPPPWYYEQQELGLNYRMTDLQAALGCSQMTKLDHFLARRREIANHYDEAFAGIPHLSVPQSGPANRARSGLHLYIVRFDYKALGTSRRHVMEALRKDGVGTQVHYIPVYRQPFHRDGIDKADFPNSEAYYRECLTVPLHPGLTDAEVERVIRAVRAVARRND